MGMMGAMGGGAGGDFGGDDFGGDDFPDDFNEGNDDDDDF